MTETVQLAVYDTLSDWEAGYATVHLTKPDWQRTPGRYRVATVGPTTAPVTTGGGVRVLPDLAVTDLDPATSAMLILPGNDLWDTDAFTPFTDAARAFLAAGVPVAAICGATGGLARAGLLDDRAHTSNAAEFLTGLTDAGYGGAARYRDVPAVTDRDLITASATAPVEFAREILARLDVYEPHVLASWYKLYGHRDPAGFLELMAA